MVGQPQSRGSRLAAFFCSSHGQMWARRPLSLKGHSRSGGFPPVVVADRRAGLWLADSQQGAAVAREGAGELACDGLEVLLGPKIPDAGGAGDAEGGEVESDGLRRGTEVE